MHRAAGTRTIGVRTAAACSIGCVAGIAGACGRSISHRRERRRCKQRCRRFEPVPPHNGHTIRIVVGWARLGVAERRDCARAGHKRWEAERIHIARGSVVELVPDEAHPEQLAVLALPEYLGEVTILLRRSLKSVQSIRLVDGRPGEGGSPASVPQVVPAVGAEVAVRPRAIDPLTLGDGDRVRDVCLHSHGDALVGAGVEVVREDAGYDSLPLAAATEGRWGMGRRMQRSALVSAGFLHRCDIRATATLQLIETQSMSCAINLQWTNGMPRNIGGNSVHSHEFVRWCQWLPDCW